jgi:hypothetical protein
LAGPTDHSAGLGTMMEDLFLESNRIPLTMLGQRERLLRTTYHGHIHVMCIMFLMQDVHRLKSSWLSDISKLLVL